ncbi:MAG: S8 family serine peptidase [Sphingomonadales bacterium]|nr:S8 family serine peptidase [Sphingomonadales bacterium]MBD3772824.1 S8 family serine peptidase [Paracoccaceae bacterium]
MNSKLIRSLLAGGAVALAGVAMATPATAQKIPNSYICVFKASQVGKAAVRGNADAAVKAEGGSVKHVYTTAIRGFAATISAQGVANMQAKNPNIAYCEQDQEVQAIGTVDAKAKPGTGGGGTSPAQTTPWGITRVNGGGAGNFATAWIIDSGIDLSHPDLNVDVGRSTFFTGRSPDDENGHGTHVAGTIAAIDNSIGVIGVAPGAPVVAVRVLDRRGSGSTSGVIAGIDYVAANGSPGDVANMSLGGGVSTTLDAAVVNAAATGVRFALAAGNETDDANNHSPARANGPNVYTISAFAQGDTFASFSNYGNPPVDYAEPGVSIYSTYKGDSYATLSGTSMATPHFAGLLLQGAIRNGGTVLNDRDSQADTIGVH